MFGLKGKVIVVTGASSGIGKQCSITFSKMGAVLVLFGRNEIQLNYTQSLLDNQPSFAFVQDIKDIDRFEIAIDQVVKKIGPIDGFVHSAGIQSTLPLRLHNKDIYNGQFDVNAVSGFEICRVLTKKNNFNPDGGSIIFVASVKGLTGASNQVGYSASKGAVIAGARSLSVELAQRKIRVNTISPGMVEDTEMTNAIVAKLPAIWTEKSKSEYPLGWVSVDDIASACVFLLSDEAKKITGINIIVDGGFTAR